METEIDPDELEYEAEETGKLEEIAAKEEPTEEVTEEAADEVKEEVAEEPTTVPKERFDEIHRAMDSERGRRKELEQKLREMEIQQARLDERLKGFNGEEEEEVDPIVSIQKETQTLKQELQNERLVNELNRQESAFKQNHPDYDEAAKHYWGIVQNTLKKRGLSDEEIAHKVREEVMDIVERTRKSSVNPAEVVYGMAKEFGFTPKTKEAVDKVTRIASGQKTTAGDVSGSPRGELTVEAAAELSEYEISELTPEQERALWG